MKYAGSPVSIVRTGWTSGCRRRLGKTRKKSRSTYRRMENRRRLGDTGAGESLPLFSVRGCCCDVNVRLSVSCICPPRAICNNFPLSSTDTLSPFLLPWGPNDATSARLRRKRRSSNVAPIAGVPFRRIPSYHSRPYIPSCGFRIAFYCVSSSIGTPLSNAITYRYLL